MVAGALGGCVTSASTDTASCESFSGADNVTVSTQVVSAVLPPAEATEVATPTSVDAVNPKSDACTPDTVLEKVAVKVCVVPATLVPVAPAADDSVGTGGECSSTNGLFTAARVAGVIAPVDCVMRTDTGVGVAEKPLSTPTVSTHSESDAVPDWDANNGVTAMPPVSRLKSPTPTPVTCCGNVAVNVSTSEATEEALLPADDDSVGPQAGQYGDPQSTAVSP